MVEYASGTGPGRVGSFSIDIRNFVIRARQRWEIVVKHALMDIFRQLHLITPVDSGFARSNWGVGMSVPDNLLPNPAQHLPYPRRLAGANFPSREAQGISILQSIPVTEGIICYIYNNTKYIVPLEYGHSRQAPAGMVRLTLTRFSNYVAAAAARS